MSSLKSRFPELAKALGTTPDALYAFQRRLVTLELIPNKSGRGPGSGVVDDFATMTAFIVAYVTHQSGRDQAEIDRSAREYAFLKAAES